MGQFDQIIREALRESMPGSRSVTGYAGGVPVNDLSVRQQTQQMMLDTISRVRNDPQQLMRTIREFASMPSWREDLMQALDIDEAGLQELLNAGQ
jgi:ABC-type transport system involved in cytochrome bd biosynthesis fused ATPase/permease subunit